MEGNYKEGENIYQMLLPDKQNTLLNSIDLVSRSNNLSIINTLSESKIEENARGALDIQSVGFKTREEFILWMRVGNLKVCNIDLPKFFKRALYYFLYGHNGEIPKSNILITCSDGRISGYTFTNDPLPRFCNKYRPMAGGILALELYEINESPNPALEELNKLLTDKNKRRILFDKFESLFGKQLIYQTKLSQAATLAGKMMVFGQEFPDNLNNETSNLAHKLIELSGDSLINNNPIFVEKIGNISNCGFITTIELQSHDDETSQNGCGAHDCDVKKALKMTALNALALNEFINERYYEIKNRIKIVRTHRITGNNEVVLNAQNENLLEKLDLNLKNAIKTKDFNPLFLQEKNLGIVRRAKTESEVDTEKHDEYIIRFSQYHKAFDLRGKSVLEQSMPLSLELAQTLTLKLISIVENNKIKRDPNQAIFLHIDSPAETDDRKKEIYYKYNSWLINNNKIQEMINSGKLIIIRSVTNGLNFFKKNSLKTKFEE